MNDWLVSPLADLALLVLGALVLAVGALILAVQGRRLPWWDSWRGSAAVAVLCVASSASPWSPVWLRIVAFVFGVANAAYAIGLYREEAGRV